ncbi:hypothetical protein C2845_PM15G03600 [Panicum miliaceum]|uniref:Uncharacterized protein n=1 Tax=Panicum miliaceum TaxID=4540 RepID=A0A3L6QCK2_PANMI|nr:hypothetical protein C2845_PM15G03600 [Panicum miliaceum]
MGSTISQDVPIVSSGVCALDFDMAVAFDNFDDGIFEEEEADMDDDNISLGSGENEYDIGDDEHNEEEETHDNVVGGQVEVEGEVEEKDGDEVNDERSICSGQCLGLAIMMMDDFLIP